MWFWIKLGVAALLAIGITFALKAIVDSFVEEGREIERAAQVEMLRDMFGEGVTTLKAARKMLGDALLQADENARKAKELEALFADSQAAIEAQGREFEKRSAELRVAIAQAEERARARANEVTKLTAIVNSPKLTEGVLEETDRILRAYARGRVRPGATPAAVAR